MNREQAWFIVLENFSEGICIVLGLFLFFDSIFFHRLSWVYPEQIKAWDFYINHWQWGLILVAIGCIGIALYNHNSRKYQRVLLKRNKYGTETTWRRENAEKSK